VRRYGSVVKGLRAAEQARRIVKSRKSAARDGACYSISCQKWYGHFGPETLVTRPAARFAVSAESRRARRRRRAERWPLAIADCASSIDGPARLFFAASEFCLSLQSRMLSPLRSHSPPRRIGKWNQLRLLAATVNLTFTYERLRASLSEASASWCPLGGDIVAPNRRAVSPRLQIRRTSQPSGAILRTLLRPSA